MIDKASKNVRRVTRSKPWVRGKEVVGICFISLILLALIFG